MYGVMTSVVEANGGERREGLVDQQPHYCGTVNGS
jgi:hypothetical protein